MKIGAIVITFHPDLALLERNIEAFHDSVEEIIVWRNSPEDISSLASRFPKIELVGDGNNRYVAEPLNYALGYFCARGYDFLLTMDQDSVFDDFKCFISKVEVVNDDSVAIYAPNPGNLNLTDDEVCSVESVITSGSLINLAATERIGGFRENYKIYWVDGEYCYWARKRGYRILVFPKCKLAQRFGKETRTLFGFTTSNYSPIVYYFLIRNMLWMRREFSDSVSLRCILYTIFYNVRGIVLGEKDKYNKLASIVKALFHGMFKQIERR